MFGSNQFGQLGNSSHGNSRQPQPLRTLDSQNVTAVACGDIFTVAVVDGKYFIIGYNSLSFYIILNLELSVYVIHESVIQKLFALNCLKFESKEIKKY